MIVAQLDRITKYLSMALQDNVILFCFGKTKTPKLCMELGSGDIESLDRADHMEYLLQNYINTQKDVEPVIDPNFNPHLDSIPKSPYNHYYYRLKLDIQDFAEHDYDPEWNPYVPLRFTLPILRLLYEEGDPIAQKWFPEYDPDLVNRLSKDKKQNLLSGKVFPTNYALIHNHDEYLSSKTPTEIFLENNPILDQNIQTTDVFSHNNEFVISLLFELIKRGDYSAEERFVTEFPKRFVNLPLKLLARVFHDSFYFNLCVKTQIDQFYIKHHRSLRNRFQYDSNKSEFDETDLFLLVTLSELGDPQAIAILSGIQCLILKYPKAILHKKSKIFNYLPRITILTIYHLEETKLPRGIQNLTLLENFTLKDTSIETLPEEIGNLQSLKTLKLAQNNIKKLPKGLINLTSLEYIDISVNPSLVKIRKNSGNYLILKQLKEHNVIIIDKQKRWFDNSWRIL